MGSLVWYPNTSNTGLATSSSVTLMGSSYLELVSVPTGGANTSNVNSVFSITTTGGALFGEIFLNLGNPGLTSLTSNVANISGWFLPAYNAAGNLFENPTYLARNPNFVIPLPTNASTVAASTIYKASRFVKIPSVPFQIYIQNNSGATLGGTTSAPVLTLAPFTIQHTIT